MPQGLRERRVSPACSLRSSRAAPRSRASTQRTASPAQMKLSREGLLWSAHGKKGQCGPYLQPIFDKSVWRTQLLYPSRTTDKSSGGCCQPLGRSTSLWGSGKTFPYTGEDGAVLLWRKRDCCLSAGMADAVARSAEFMSNAAEGIAARRSALFTPPARTDAAAR